MTGNFNIRDCLWDSTFPHHSTISDDLFIIANSFNLSLSNPTNPCPTRYLDMHGEANSILDLMFLHSSSPKLDSHHILSENRLSSDHAPLSVEIPIIEEVIQSLKFTILSKSNQEKAFIDEVILNYKSLNTNNIDVVATTRWNGTRSLLTSAKLSVGYLVVGIIRELNKELSLHCSSIYINYMWSMLQQY